ncbi:MAG: ATP-binding protein [Acidobacteria bacterium]|nr:ATP-binding protein [Acidobacteriota bacterium]
MLDIPLISKAGWTAPVIAVSLLAAAIIVSGTWLLARLYARRVARLRAFAEGLLSGRLSQVPLRESGDDLGTLAGCLNRLSSRLRDLSSGLTAEAERSEAILAGMSEAVVAVDQRLFVVFRNEAFARLVGANAALPVAMPVQELAPDREFVEMLRAAVISRQSSQQRLRLPGPLGGRTFDVHAAPLTVAGRRGAVAVLHDITELERLERVRRDFVANVSHELRTPLTAIGGYAETLLEGALEDRENNRRFVEIIKAHAIRLNSIASDLLTLAELDADQPAPGPEPVSVRAAIEAALRTVEAEAALRGVELCPAILEEAVVLGNKTRLEQALVNLLDNAIKFNRPGGQARIESGPADGGQVRIAVADTGIGIPPAHLPRIFERFYRVDKARSRDVGGTGLGLSIVKHVVERMNGTVTAQSEPGKGSTFTIVLPAAP